jgi:YggT family protein
MRVLLHVLDIVLAIYTWLLLAGAVLYLLIGFGRLDAHRRGVAAADAWLSFVTEPARRPMRRILLGLGGVDYSPLFAMLIVTAIRYVIAIYVLPKLS